MSLFETLIPAAFPVLAIAHFFALLSPGPDFFLLTGYGIRYKLKGSAFIAAGISIANAIYIIISIIGWSSIRDNGTLFKIVESIGAVYLLWLGFRLTTSQKREMETDHSNHSRLNFYRQFLLGFSSAILNPKNALFYMSLMTVILGSQVTLIQQITCGIWMFSLVLIWDLLIILIVSHPLLQSVLKKRIYFVERASGAVLISFSIGLFINRLGMI